eukprot:jgi/Picsp_1/123/NSC_00123-R1_30s ribosomal protein s17
MTGPTEFVGKVISNRMQKSVLVAIDRLKTIKKYQTTIKRTTKLMAHDEDNECNVGDTVRIKLCRPLSKRKSWTVTDVIYKTKILDLNKSFAASGVQESTGQ